MSGPSLSGQPRTLQWVRSRLDSGVITGAQVYLFADGQPSVLRTAASSVNALRVFAVDVPEWEVYERELLWTLRLRYATGDVSPAQSGFFSVYPVTGLGGNQAAQSITLGTEVDGSRTPTRALVNNAVLGPDESGPFELPASGLYTLAYTSNGAFAATSYAGVFGRLSAICR